MAVANSDVLLSPEETAKILGVRVQTLSLWRCSKRYDLPYTKVGRCVRYRKGDLDAWLAARTVTHTGQPVAVA